MGRARRTALLAVPALLAIACGGGEAGPVLAPHPPVIASFAATPALVTVGRSTTLVWSVAGATTVTIDNGVGPVTGSSREVTPGATTTYTLTATNSAGSTTARATVVVDTSPRPVITSFVASPRSVALGGSSTLRWTVTHATSLAIDGGVGEVQGESRVVTPAATTTYTLTATNDTGQATASVTVTVEAPSRLQVACSGDRCGAASGSRYAGPGPGIWRLVNGTGSEETLDLSISGLSRGQGVLLLFSNGLETATTLPWPGDLDDGEALSSPLGLAAEDPASAGGGEDGGHAAMLQRNREVARAIRRLPPGSALPLASPAAPVASTAVGDRRVWWDSFSTPVAYATVARAACALPGGRNAIFWVDPAATSTGTVTDADLQYFQDTFCGSSGAYARVTRLLGEPWGSAVAPWSDTLIQDGPGAPQDVHVVFLNVPMGTPWAGYYDARNGLRRAALPSSNEALAFFVNASVVKARRAASASTLLHELTHLVNHYQRSIVRGSAYDTWLEEMSAMMTEDLVTPATTPDRVAVIPDTRVGPYVRCGGGVSLVAWGGAIDADLYFMGGALAAFLDRRHGLAIYAGMLGCDVRWSGVTCVDALIRAAGGEGFADDLARMGAAVYGLLPPDDSPPGWSFAGTDSGGYALAGIDPGALGFLRPGRGVALGEAFPATTHSYVFEILPDGATSYRRTSVVVPAGVTLVVVVVP